MKVVADLHLHSKYSRAVSPEMNLQTMATVALKKGIQLLTTGDWTHPLWLSEIEKLLEDDGSGFYSLKGGDQKIKFLLSCEISSIYSQGGKGRRVHNLVFVPNISVAKKINKELVRRGANLRSDGRPIIGLSAKDLVDLVLNIEPTVLIIPAHVWTPWFSVFGSESGFDSLNEAFGNFEKNIYGIETGLSSDPAMNWRVDLLDNKSIMSFSDAHSPAKMGRELTVFELSKESYEGFFQAVVENKIAFTIEFFPEEGKYHFSGHRNCKVSYSPSELLKKGDICPNCSRKLTIGVATRVEDLATRSQSDLLLQSDDLGFNYSKLLNNRPRYKMLVPLIEIISESLNFGAKSKAVLIEYERLVLEFGSELSVLLKISHEDLSKVTNRKIAEGIIKVREGDIQIQPGFDGEYGQVRIWQESEKENFKDQIPQLALF